LSPKKYVGRKPIARVTINDKGNDGSWRQSGMNKNDYGEHVTMKGQTRDPNMLRVQYLENSNI